MMLIFGELKTDFYLGWMLFSLLGFAVQKYVLFLNRGGVKKPFKLWYFLDDNKVDLIAGFLLTLLAGRFHEDLMKMMGYNDPTNGNKMLLALLFGFFYTSLLQILRKTKGVGTAMKSNKRPDGTKIKR